MHIDLDAETGAVISALIEVHRCLGPGLLESTYEACVCAELAQRGLAVERQRPMSLEYKGLVLECGYRLDLVVNNTILVELKSVERLLPVHVAQVVTYLRLAKLRAGILANFNTVKLKDGLRRVFPNSK